MHVPQDVPEVLIPPVGNYRSVFECFRILPVGMQRFPMGVDDPLDRRVVAIIGRRERGPRASFLFFID